VHNRPGGKTVLRKELGIFTFGDLKNRENGREKDQNTGKVSLDTIMQKGEVGGLKP